MLSKTPMKVLLPLLAAWLSFAAACPAQTGREVVRDASGRVVQTIERQKGGGNMERAVVRDASGRILGTSTSQTSPGGQTRTTYRDASGRFTGKEGQN